MSDYNRDTYDDFCVPSTIPFPDMRQSDPNPNGSLDSISDAVIAGYGPGDEFVTPDGTARTRWKAPGMISGGGGGGGGGGADGGTP